MKNPHDFPAADASTDDDMTARLAEIKRKAAGRVPTSGLDEQEILTEAALGLAERRAARGDFVGTLIWEKIASGNADMEGYSHGRENQTDSPMQESIPSEDTVPVDHLGRDNGKGGH
jgi:hypothetical protein